MAISESQLETWSHQGAAVGSRDTYAAVKRALEAPDAQYAGKTFDVFLQGSYGNDTNIWAESDVDVVIRLDAIYYSDTSALTPNDLALFNAAFAPATYAYNDYKAHVTAALVKAFGATDVKSDKKAIKIKANGNRRSADVVVATDFHRYYSGPSGLLGPQCEHGICFFDSSGQRITNYPKQHSANCTQKHQATNGWFKPMVRILKNMRSRLVNDGSLNAGIAPSYYIEGLLYNVPPEIFGVNNKYAATFVEALKWILQTDRTKLVCANREYYLLGNSAVQWPTANCDIFLDKVTNLWNKWNLI